MAWNWSFGRWIGDQLGGTAETDREFNSAEAQKNREWQEEMSNTAYQRQVADMQKAGLNPAMMYGSGATGGAATPSSTPASASSNNSNLLSSAVKIGTLIAGIALKNPKMIAMGFGADITSARKRSRYS